MCFLMTILDPILPGGLTYVADNPAPRDLAYFAVRPTNPETQRVKIGNYEGE